MLYFIDDDTYKSINVNRIQAIAYSEKPDKNRPYILSLPGDDRYVLMSEENYAKFKSWYLKRFGLQTPLET